jgi:hypothetical protein
MTIDDYLFAAQSTFTPERARGKHVVIQYEFSGKQTGICHLIIADGSIQAGHGPHPTPTATVATDFSLWMRILAYDLDPLLAYQEGLYTVTGDLETLMEADAWFAR